MSSAKTVKISISISLPPDLYEEAKNASGNLSHLVAEALRPYLHQGRVQEALKSFGRWQPREKSSVDLVNALRSEAGSGD